MNESLIWKKCLASILLLTLIACSGNIPDPGPADTWHIKYSVSGGIMGKVQSLKLSGDGHFTVFDKRRGIKQAFIASKQQLDLLSNEINRLTTNSEQKHSGAKVRQRCADCIARQLTIRHQGRLFRYKDTIGIAGKRSFRVILDTLSRMLEQGLAAATDDSANR